MQIRRLVKLIYLYVLASLIGLICFLVIGEMAARAIEDKIFIEGIGAGCLDDKILGFLPHPGIATIVTSEYKTTANINSFCMNDDPIEESVNAKVKIMVLGDSHTFASGVSPEESWPNVLEKLLFKGDKAAGTVYNCAAQGYNLGQYLLRMRQLEQILKPDVIIIGFSTATDLYDLIPPRLGGFVYRPTSGRVYFDLDARGELIECHELEGKNLAATAKENLPLLIKIKSLLKDRSVLYRRLRRSKLAMWMFMNINPSLWPGQDTALKKNLNADDKYRWLLAQQIIKKIAEESFRKNRIVVLVNIPYLAQVYDEVWLASFGRRPEEYDRWIPGERLRNICNKAGVYYIDTTKVLVEEVRRHKRWVHYRYDAHPTVEGHKIIAAKVYESLRPILLQK